MKRAIAAAVLSLFTAVLCCGCSLTDGVETLLTPPGLTQAQEEIYSALTQRAGEDIIMKYPRSDGDASAFTYSDLDGDGSDEAIVFYSKKSGDTLRLGILSRSKGEWVCVCDEAAGGRILDTVLVKKLGASEKTRIITGFGSSEAQSRVFYVLEYSDGQLSTVIENESYSILRADDLDGDGENEIFTADAQSSSASAQAKIYNFSEGGGVKVEEPCSLDESYSGYENAAFDNKGGVYLDCSTGNGTIVTVILSAADGRLTKKYSPETADNKTLRRSAYISGDFDDDGDIEIPVPHLCTGYDESSSDPVYFTSWYESHGDKLMYCREGYCSVSGGYSFDLPEDWYGRVTARRDLSENTFTLCEGKDPVKGGEIFTVAAASGRKAKKYEEDEEFELLHSTGGRKYFIRINEDNSFSADKAQIMIRFKFRETE